MFLGNAYLPPPTPTIAASTFNTPESVEVPREGREEVEGRTEVAPMDVERRRDDRSFTRERARLRQASHRQTRATYVDRSSCSCCHKNYRRPANHHTEPTVHLFVDHGPWHVRTNRSPGSIDAYVRERAREFRNKNRNLRNERGLPARRTATLLSLSLHDKHEVYWRDPEEQFGREKYYWEGICDCECWWGGPDEVVDWLNELELDFALDTTDTDHEGRSEVDADWTHVSHEANEGADLRSNADSEGWDLISTVSNP